ncbi:hypothetical protein EZJ58_0822 [Sodalis ligni]|uniref:Uncharacterized protein n=1 Tax=Sodalis ligni TaxID=2697027 RepID=A0A4V2Q2H0_9GAMM|nr:hypothetical protein EZJ58_0822 [Sodalis ligni]
MLKFNGTQEIPLSQKDSNPVLIKSTDLGKQKIILIDINTRCRS